METTHRDAPSNGLLSLQATAGNTAVTHLVQRQPGPGAKQPKWLTDAQAELKKMFPKDKLLKKVVVKDFSKLNAHLKSSGFGAWTQSKTEIYLKDPTAWIDPNNPASKRWPAMVVRYVLRHEAEHIRDFAKGGPPTTWQEMLQHEAKTYDNDIKWLASADGKKQVPDKDLRDILTDQAVDSADAADKLLADTKTLTGQAREDQLYSGMVTAKLIPPGSPKDPRDLYKQPP